MSYRLNADRALANDVRHIAGKQLTLAIAKLRAVGDPRSDDAVHEARRHIKKTRALLRLVRTALGGRFDTSNRRLRIANRMLSAVADGESAVDTLDRVHAKYGDRLPRRTVGALRTALLDREQHIDRKARRDRVLPRVATILRHELQALLAWRLRRRGFRAVADGLERTVRRMRLAARRAESAPTVDRYHSWRCRAKDLWLQVRLLEGRCRRRLLTDERRLEALDGYLGEYHNIVLLERVLVDDAIVSRRETARCLHVFRRYQAELRYRATTVGRAIAEEKPKHFVHRVKGLWQSDRGRAASRKPWPRAA